MNLRTAVRKWPTPTKMDAVLNASPERWKERQAGKAAQGIRLQFPLHVAVKMEWPTPRKCSAMAATMTPEAAWADRFPNLETVLARRLWPTPTKSDADGGPGTSGRDGGLNVVVGGQMNPTWVEWLMGWPLGWTDLRASAMDRFRQWCDSHGGV